MDYLEYFGLGGEPFSHAPAPRFYYGSRQHTSALERLRHTASTMKGLALLVGDIGHGKTTLARRMLDTLPEDTFEAALLVMVHTGVTPSWLLKRISIQLGVRDPAEDKVDILGQLHERLMQIHALNKKAVVLIDEAQMLNTREIMEEFRGLLNLEVPGQKLISFVFFGLPELESNLALDPPLAQRVSMRYHLKPLVDEDTARYIEHRLQLAGCTDEIFDAAALQEVHHWSSGVPRVINSICDNVMLELFFARERRAGAERVFDVAENLGLTRQIPSPSEPAQCMDQPAVDGGPGSDAIAVIQRGDDAPDPTLAGIDPLSPENIAAQVAAEPLEDMPVMDSQDPALDSFGIEVDIDIDGPTDEGGASSVWDLPEHQPEAVPPGDTMDPQHDSSADIDVDVMVVTTEEDGVDVEALPEMEISVAEVDVLEDGRGMEVAVEDLRAEGDPTEGLEVWVEPTSAADTLSESPPSSDPAPPPAAAGSVSSEVTTTSGKKIDLREIDDLLADIEGLTSR